MRKEARRGKSQLKTRDLLADSRCSQAVLGFLSTTEVGRLVPAEGDAGSVVSEWEFWERRGREEERRTEAEELGAGRESPLFVPTPPSMAAAGEE